MSDSIFSPTELASHRKALQGLLFPQRQGFERQEVQTTYAVLDGASIPDLLEHLYVDEKRPEFECLYRGTLAPDMAEVAPYLVRLDWPHPFSDWLLDEAWGKHWGIFVRTNAAFTAIRRHFRRFLRVKKPDGKVYLFRFYDPRVARIFLPTCNREELQFLFGPISNWLLEDENLRVALDLTLANGSLLCRKQVLLQPEPGSATGSRATALNIS